MGQQQLLLVILVTILVGIATVVGINVFGSSSINANHDAVRNDIAQVASSAQGWFIKPEALGGGGRDYEGITFNNVTFPAEEITNGGLTATNANGSYVITAPAEGDTEFVITATPASNNGDDYTSTFIAKVGDGEMAIGGYGEAAATVILPSAAE